MKNNLLKKVLKSTAAKLIAAFLMFGAIQESSAVAAIVYSTWNPTNTDFNSAVNWTPTGAPTTTNYAVFSGVANPALLPQLTANTIIMGLNFTNSAAGYTISTANNSVLTLSSSYSGLVTPGSSPAIWAQNTTGTNRISTALMLTPTTTSTWNQAKGGTLEVTGNISESGGSKQLSLASGVGTGLTSYYYLSGSNSYTGATTIASGALLTLGSANVLGTTAGATTISGTINLNGYSIIGEAITGGGKGTDGVSGFLVNNSATAASVTGSTLALSSASGNYIGGTGNMTIGSTITAALNTYLLTKVGTGEITLAGNNTYAGLTTVTAGTLTLSGNNSGAAGGVTLTTGTLNINNANALGTGLLELGAVTSTTYGSSIINNTSGGALTYLGLSGVKWSGVSPAGIQFGTSVSTSANNMDFGTGLVTASTDRSMNIAGTGVTISMGILTASGTAGSYTYKIDGVGNTLDLDGWRISGATTPTQAVQHKINASANVNIGTIENGTGAFANSVSFNNDGVTRLTGNNTYTGTTEFVGGGTNIISGNNSSAVGNVTIAGGSGTGKMPYVRLDSINAISSSSSLLGASSTAQAGTIDFHATTAYIFNSFLGNNMIFTNSYGQVSVVTFTNAANIFTSSSGNSGGRTLLNNSANLTVVFNGTMDIGSTTTALNDTFGGTGDWNVKGGVFSTTAGSVRGLNKTGSGKLTLEGASSYNGDTIVSLGTLLVTTGASITGSSSQLNGGTLDVRGTIGAVTQSGGTLLVSGTTGTTIVNSGTSTVNVGGTIGSTTINGSLLSVNGNAGNVLVNLGGTLGGSGSVQLLTLNGGIVAPGNSPGLLTAYELNGSNGTFQFQLGAPTTRGSTYDAINVTTLLTLGASTAFTFETLNSYTYGIGDSYDLFNFASIDVSAFDNAVLLAALPNLDTANSNLRWDVNTFNADGVVNVIPEPSTLSLMFGGLSGLIALRIMRRKNG